MRSDEDWKNTKQNIMDIVKYLVYILSVLKVANIAIITITKLKLDHYRHVARLTDESWKPYIVFYWKRKA